MAKQTKQSTASNIEAATKRARKLNDRIIERARRGGEESLEAYEGLLQSVADYQQSAGQRAGEFVSTLGRAQANFTRELAKAGPSAAQRVGSAVGELTGSAARQARRVPGAKQAEGELRGAGASQGDLPIARYDSLNAGEVVKRLQKLSEVDLNKVDAYERKHQNRKTVRDKIASLRGEQG
jgi:hypothetical protein